MPTHRVTIVGRDADAMADLVRRYGIEVFRHTTRRLEGGRISVDAYVDSEEIGMLQADHYELQVHEDVHEWGKARQAEVGQGNRYEQTRPD